MAAINNNLDIWKQEAEKEAKKYSDSIKQSSQYLIDQLNQQKQNTLEQLQNQQDNAIYNLNTNKYTKIIVMLGCKHGCYYKISEDSKNVLKYRELYYNFIGGEWECDINKLNIDIYLPNNKNE